MMHNGNVMSEIFFMMMLIKHAFQKKKLEMKQYQGEQFQLDRKKS